MASYIVPTSRSLVNTYSFHRIQLPLKKGYFRVRSPFPFFNGYYIRQKVYVYTKRRMRDEALYLDSIIFKFELLTRNIH